jgi:hypothetical protein
MVGQKGLPTIFKDVRYRKVFGETTNNRRPSSPSRGRR